MASKLLVINSRFLPIVGGGETYTMEIMEYFSKCGLEVHLLTQQRGHNKTMWGNSHLHFIDGFDDNSLNINLCMKGMRGVLDQVKPDLVHVHNIMPFYVYSSVTGVKEYPTILTIHNTPHPPHRLFGSFNDNRTEAAFCRSLFATPHCQAVLFGSQYYKDAYLSAVPELRATPTFVNHYFPPHESVGPREFRQLERTQSASVRLLFPSRIIKRKGIEDMLYAMKILPDTYELLLPAFAHQEDGEYTKHIARLITELGLENRVVCSATSIGPRDMPAFYKQADIVVIPSHYEGFGIAAVEAMSWGVPIITTGVGGLGEIIDDAITGLYTPTSNPEALARNIVKLSHNQELGRTIARSAHDRVFSSFTHTRHMDALGKLYAEVSSGRD